MRKYRQRYGGFNVAIKRTKEQWKKLFDEYEISGLSQAKYCEQEHINLKSFNNAYRRMHQADNDSNFVPVNVKDKKNDKQMISVVINNVPVSYDVNINDYQLKRIFRLCMNL